jgi:uncharacterized protein (TIGR03067 family)
MVRLWNGLAILVLCFGVACADEASEKFLKELAGTYKVLSIKRAGEEGEKEKTEAMSITLTGNKVVINFGKEGGKEVKKEGILIVDPSQKPVALDLTPSAGSDEGKPLLGIIEVKGDEITLAFADDFDTARPKEFKSTKENKVFLITLKKSK